MYTFASCSSSLSLSLSPFPFAFHSEFTRHASRSRVAVAGAPGSRRNAERKVLACSTMLCVIVIELFALYFQSRFLYATRICDL